MNVVLLAKDRRTHDPAVARFAAVGASRGHEVRVLDKEAFVAADLRGVDVVCLKSHVDDDKVWRVIDAAPVKPVNRRMLGADRTRLDATLRAAGVRTPRSAANADEVLRLAYPVIRKSRSITAPSDVQILDVPPAQVDNERFVYQEMAQSDGATHKVYCIGSRAFLVKEFDAAHGSAQEKRAIPRQRCGIPESLAATALHVGRVLGLEVYGLDFVGIDDKKFLIDINPFPSFRYVPRAAQTLWDYLEDQAARA